MIESLTESDCFSAKSVKVGCVKGRRGICNAGSYRPIELQSDGSCRNICFVPVRRRRPGWPDKKYLAWKRDFC